MRLSFTPPSSAPKSKLLTIENFAALYGAAEFSLLNGYPLSSHVVINWTALGVVDEAQLGAAFLTFTKCLRDFLTRRLVPPLWIYAHERGPKTGWHTHMATFLPVETPALRTGCMEWLRGWPIRHTGRRVPHAVRLRVPKDHDPKLHWLIFNYLTKGYDPAAIVQSGRHAPDGQNIMLGDLIAWPWRDPGVMNMRKRVGYSQCLGPAAQKAGLPARWTGMRTPQVMMKVFPDSFLSSLPLAAPAAFRSTFEDGCYDVRKLYGDAFAQWMSGAPSHATATIVTAGGVDTEDLFPEGI